jgi:hypothetical protein
MRAESWGGLVTNASPFALPPGAAAEQTNLATHIPGQLTLRGGMRPVEFDEAGPEESPLSLATYASGGDTFVICLFADGSLHALPAPDRGDELGDPEGSLAGGGSGTIVTSYTQEASIQ